VEPDTNTCSHLTKGEDRHVTELLDRLHVVLDELNGASMAGLPGEVKAQVLESVCRAGNKVMALESTAINSFEATAEHRAEGHTSIIQWWKQHLRWRGPEAARKRRRAHQCRAMPLAHDSAKRGLLGPEHLRGLDWCRKRIGDDAFADREADLVAYAEGHRFEPFAHRLEYVVAHADPAAAADRDGKEDEAQWLDSDESLGGGGSIGGWFGRIGFRIWDAELQRIAKLLYEADWAEAKDRLGRKPYPHELRRNDRQRRAAAAVILAERSAAYGDDFAPPSPFCLNVMASADVVEQLIAAVLSDAGVEAVDEIELTADSLHELEDGTVVSPRLVLVALLTGKVRGYLHDPDGTILRYGRGRRLFSGDQMDALLVKYRRCCHPYGCDRKGRRWLQGDHVVEHEDGGPTDLDNAEVECEPHNRWKHNTKHHPPPPGDPPTDTGQCRHPPAA